MPGQVINRREEHKRSTRQALEAAAMALFARKGFEATTVEEIAAEAGVSVRTFFRYFASKQHVLFGDVAFERAGRLGHALAERPADEAPLESIRAVLDASDVTDPAELAQIRDRFQLMAEQPALVPTYLVINRQLQQEVAAFVAARTGLSPWHPYPLTVAAAVSSAWDIALTAWAAGQAGSLTEARRAAFDRLTIGLADASAPAADRPESSEL